MAVQMTRAEYQAKYGVQPTAPTTTPAVKSAPVSMTRAEFASKYGVQPTVTPTPTEEPGLIKSVAQSVLQPFERIGKTITDKVAPNLSSSKGLLGNEIKPINNVGEFAGETIMGISNFMGGGVVKEGAKVAAKSIFKRALPKIANVTKNVVIPGVKAGAVYGEGQSLERGDNLQESLTNIGENAIYGGGGALVIGAGLPAVAKPIVNTVRGAIRRSTPEGRMAVTIENRAKELEAINNNYVNMRKSTSYTPDSRKSNINRVAETDVLINSVDENGLIRTKETGGAIDQYKALKLDGKESVVRANLERNQETARITDIKNKLDNVIETGNLPIDEAEKAKATNKVIVDALLREYPDGNVPLVRLHDEKIKVANLAYKNPDPSVRTKAKDIARGYKELVEDYSSFDVKKINQELAPIYEDIKFLQELDGKRVKGGKLSKNFAQISGNIIGGAVGNAVAGPYGAAIGAATGGELASKVRGLALSKTLGRAVNKEIPKNQVLEKAKELSTKTGGIYSKIRGSRNLKYNTANTTNNTAMPRIVPINKPQVKSDIPSKQTLRAFLRKEPVPVEPKKPELPGNQMIRDKMLKKAIEEQTSNKVKPLYEPVIPDDKLPIIQAGGKTVSKFKKVDKALPIIQAGANRQAFGAVAGIQTDEEGNMTFDPKMAVAGAIAGNIAGRKGTKETMDKLAKKYDVSISKDNGKTWQSAISPSIKNTNELFKKVGEKAKSIVDEKTNELLDPEEGMVYYHGTSKENKESLLKNGINTLLNKKGFAEQPEAFYIGSKSEADMYGKDVVEVKVKKGEQINTLSLSSKEWAEVVGTAKNKEETTKAIKELRNRGYDAVNHGDEIEVLNPNKFEVSEVAIDKKKPELPGNQMIRDKMLKKAIEEQTSNKVKPLYEPVIPDDKLPIIQAGGKTVSKFKKVDKALPTIQAGANRQAFGAVAGIQTDEEGNVTFDPKMAAMGAIAGNVAGRKGTKELFKKVGEKAVEVYKEAGNLTTKILKDLEGKSTVSKQYILDATNRGELKQQERDLIRSVLDGEGDTVNVSDFAKKVQTELLPLERNMVGSNYPGATPYASTRAKYENITLPKESRGSVKDYSEHVYESPIKTSAGNVHFSSTFRADSGYNGKGFPNYFGHTRIEDMADDQTRRVIEVQSDLYQKGNLEIETSEEAIDKVGVKAYDKSKGDLKDAVKAENEARNTRRNEVAKLQQYSNPTAHFRMVREEIKKASDDGKTKLQFPTGETAMKIEGLGNTNNWRIGNYEEGVPIGGRSVAPLTKDNIKVGMIVNNDEDWVVTDVLGDGKFKAVSKRNLEALAEDMDSTWEDELQNVIDDLELGVTETFDVSGKIDTNNPIYRFYEKDLGRYLTSKYGAKIVTDDKGVNWYEVAIDKKKHGLPVEAFALAPLSLKDNEESDDSYMFTTKKKFSGEAIQRASIKKEKVNTLEIMKAIENNEATTTGDKYTFSKFSGDERYGDDLGKYQITSARLREKAKKFIGKKVSDEEFLASPYLQELFIEKQIKWLADKGLSPKEILAVHRNGWGDLSKEAIAKALNKRKDYVDKGVAWIKEKSRSF